MKKILQIIINHQTVMLLEELQRKKPELLKIAEKYGVSNIRVFGSVARGEERPDSDVDLLVHLEKNRDGFDLGGFQYNASELLGKYVDVVMDTNIYQPMRPYILNDATPL